MCRERRNAVVRGRRIWVRSGSGCLGVTAVVRGSGDDTLLLCLGVSRVSDVGFGVGVGDAAVAAGGAGTKHWIGRSGFDGGSGTRDDFEAAPIAGR